MLHGISAHFLILDLLICDLISSAQDAKKVQYERNHNDSADDT
jgi:hypothetical protein